MAQSFMAFVERSIQQHWELDALSDYKGNTLQYKDVALGIYRLHQLFDAIGIKKGDKIALCGRNSSHWGVIYLATLTYGAVSVPILHDFKADNIHHIVNHSEARLFFTDGQIWENLDENEMPHLKGIIDIGNFSLLNSRSNRLANAYQKRGQLIDETMPKGFTQSAVKYHQDSPDELAYISYTSGTTSFSKGVMVPYRSLWSNIQFAHDNMKIQSGDGHVCMLPLAHAFGLLFEFLFEFTKGCHIYFLTRIPSQKIIFQAYQEIKPTLVVTVPLIVEKVVKKAVLPKLQTRSMRLALKIPIVRTAVLKKVRTQLYNLFGGNFMEIVVGGAALNEEVEHFLREIQFPYTIGYGMTECGPLICYSSAASFKEKSCGRKVDRMDIKIASEDPENVPGEIFVRGQNVALGYYKNPDSTKETFGQDGWMRTGDLATMDRGGNVSIKGRSKNMLLGPNGQNIYPEEIEEKLSNLPYVVESVVVQKEGKIIGLVYPDYHLAIEKGLSNDKLAEMMEENRKTLNDIMPKYSQVAAIRLYPEEFEKTPKRSIKRYLYQ